MRGFQTVGKNYFNPDTGDAWRVDIGERQGGRTMSATQLGLVFFPAFDWAISPTHPEREERLLYTRDQIVEEGLLDLSAIREYKPRIATIRDLERVHIGVPAIGSLVTDAHLVSAGGAITAAEAVMRGGSNTSLCFGSTARASRDARCSWHPRLLYC